VSNFKVVGWIPQNLSLPGISNQARSESSMKGLRVFSILIISEGILRTSASMGDGRVRILVLKNLIILVEVSKKWLFYFFDIFLSGIQNEKYIKPFVTLSKDLKKLTFEVKVSELDQIEKRINCQLKGLEVCSQFFSESETPGDLRSVMHDFKHPQLYSSCKNSQKTWTLTKLLALLLRTFKWDCKPISSWINSCDFDHGRSIYPKASLSTFRNGVE
jgi:hypothetical protein